jgi:hypothetical protein
MTTQAPIKNYAIAIASPLLKSPVARIISKAQGDIFSSLSLSIFATGLLSSGDAMAMA